MEDKINPIISGADGVQYISPSKYSEGEIVFNTDDGASVIKMPLTNKETKEVEEI